MLLFFPRLVLNLVLFRIFDIIIKVVGVPVFPSAFNVSLKKFMNRNIYAKTHRTVLGSQILGCMMYIVQYNMLLLLIALLQQLVETIWYLIVLFHVLMHCLILHSFLIILVVTLLNCFPVLLNRPVRRLILQMLWQGSLQVVLPSLSGIPIPCL